MGDFRMPALGADMDKGTIVEWRVAPGDVVHRGDIVAVVDTDKADIEIETFESGTIAELLVPPGDEVPVGTVLARIDQHVAARPTPEPNAARRGAAGSAEPAAEPERTTPPTLPPIATPSPVANTVPVVVRHPRSAPQHAATGARPPVSPRARRRAAELGVDLASLTELARGRPITGDDVERAAARQRHAVATPPRPATDALPAERRERPVDAAQALAASAIGRLMARSKREIPHFYVSEDVDVTDALTWMEQHNTTAPIEQRLVPAALLLRAVVVALADSPELNGHVVDGEPVRCDAVHLGIAVSQRRGGLIAPVVQNAHQLDLSELMRAMREVVGRARSARLRSTDVAEATITVTNLGDQGSASVFGVIVPPQIAIVGFGRITERPWVLDGAVVARRVVTATLAADHRASHGHGGARFLRSLAHALEHPEVLV